MKTLFCILLSVVTAQATAVQKADVQKTAVQKTALQKTEPKTEELKVLLIDSFHKKTTLELRLSRGSEGTFCEVPGVAPRHQIYVRTLDSFKAPFAPTPEHLGSCRKLLRWGSAERCYEDQKIPLVEDLIRWCVNI